MKTPEPSKSTQAPDLESEAAATATTTETEPAEDLEPEPEPWTAERALVWNAYYDLFVAGFVLLLVFIAAATRITNASFWTFLQAGRLISEQGWPILTEPFLYTVEEGTRWINVPWLVQWLSFELYALVGRLVPRNAEQNGAVALVAVFALVRVATAVTLLNIRRPGPGLWWSAITTALALGVVVGPLGVTMGGIAERSGVTPATVGLFLLAFQLLVLHWAYNLGRIRALYLLVPLFVVWANVDPSFALGLILLLAMVLGGPFQRRSDAEAVETPGHAKGLLVFGLCVLACLVNPSTYRVFAVGFEPFMELVAPSGMPLTMDQLSLFGPQSQRYLQQLDGSGIYYGKLIVFYFMLVGAGLLSFLLNWRRFHLGRFLIFAVTAVCWAVALRFNDVFAIVWAATVALNGQEWYHDVFGVEGRIRRVWSTWSVGGRLATIALVTLAILKGVTGYGNQYLEPAFGFGVDPDEFSIEAASYLRNAPLEGRVLNLTMAQGDALNWLTYPRQRPFLDSRRQRSTAPIVQQLEDLKRALANDDREVWQPVFDEHNISVVMLDHTREFPARTYETLRNSPDWILFYDDGNTIMFGLAESDDLAFFEQNVLDAQVIAFQRGNPPRPFDRPPSAVDWYDRIFQTRALIPTQPHVKSAQRWLSTDRGVTTLGPGSPPAPTIAQCLLAIQEARDALAVKPDDPDAFYMLGLAYRRLGEIEAHLLIEAEPAASAASGMPGPVRLRMQQRMAALHYAIQTTPRPQSEFARQTLSNMHFELSGLYQLSGYIDLARDQLARALDLLPEDEIAAETQNLLDQLTEIVEQLRVELEDLELQGQIDPVQLAMLAIENGAVGLGIEELVNAELSGISMATVKWRLVDLFCDTGQPDRALDYLTGISDDPDLSTGPGTSAFRQGRVWFLLGDYNTSARYFWEGIAIPQLESTRTRSALETMLMATRGQFAPAAQTAMQVPNQVFQQAEWEYLTGLALLEGGFPTDAGPHFQAALELDPELPARAVAEYYLEQLGEEIPPPPDPDAESPLQGIGRQTVLDPPLPDLDKPDASEHDDPEPESDATEESDPDSEEE